MSSADVPIASGLKRAWIMISILLASMMQTLDSTVVIVALPNIQGSLECTQAEVAWIVTSYIIAAGITMTLTGWLSARFGRRTIFIASAAGFTAASLVCGLATDLPQLTISRVIQGILGAPLVPLTTSVLLDITPKERQGRAMSVLSTCVALAPVFGPALGGWLTTTLSWRWIFFVNLPIGLLAVLGLFLCLPERNAPRSRFDFLGFSALGIAIASLQLFLDRGVSNGWFDSLEIWVEATVAVIAVYMFVVHTWCGSNPIVPRQVFKDRNFLIGCAFQCLLAGIFLSTVSLLPSLMQQVLGYPTLAAGLSTAPRGAGQLVAAFVVGYLIGRVDVRLLTAFGCVTLTVSLWQMSQFTVIMDSTPIVIASFVQGIGAGFAYVPLTVVAFSSTQPLLRAEATSFFNLMRTVGGSAGIAVVQTVLANQAQSVHATLVGNITPFNLDSVLPVDTDFVPALLMLEGTVRQQSSMIAYGNVFLLMVLVGVIATVLLAFARADRSK